MSSDPRRDLRFAVILAATLAILVALFIIAVVTGFMDISDSFGPSGKCC